MTSLLILAGLVVAWKQGQAVVADQGRPNVSIGVADPLADFVVTGKDAVGLLPPQVVASDIVDSASWSPDGKYVIAIRHGTTLRPSDYSKLFSDPGATPALSAFSSSAIAWSLESRKSTEVIKLTREEGSVDDVQWIPGGSNAIAQIVTVSPPVEGQKEPNETQRFAMISCSSGQARNIYASPDGAYTQLAISPLKPIAALFSIGRAEDGSRSEAISVVSADGSVSRPLHLEVSKASGYDVEWAANGDGPVLVQSVGVPGAKLQRHFFRFDPASGSLTPDDGVALYRDPRLAASVAAGPSPAARAGKPEANQPPAPELRVVFSKSKATLQPNTASVRTAWLSSSTPGEDQNAAICADATAAVLSPNFDAVLYIENGVALVRPLMRVDKDVYTAAKNAALRAQALMQAKQVGLGMLMYSADNDDKLPGKNDNLGDILGPYLKNGDLLRNFVYTFGGGLTTDIASPAETALGYVPGPGGQAVIYADGHAKWHSGS